MMETYKYKPDCGDRDRESGRDEPGRKRRVLPHDGEGTTESEVDEWAERGTVQMIHAVRETEGHRRDIQERERRMANGSTSFAADRQRQPA